MFSIAITLSVKFAVVRVSCKELVKQTDKQLKL